MMPHAVLLQPLGDAALLVRFDDRLSDAANRRAIALAADLAANPPAGVAEIAPGLVSVLLRLRSGHRSLPARRRTPPAAWRAGRRGASGPARGKGQVRRRGYRGGGRDPRLVRPRLRRPPQRRAAAGAGDRLCARASSIAAFTATISSCRGANWCGRSCRPARCCSPPARPPSPRRPSAPAGTSSARRRSGISTRPLTRPRALRAGDIVTLCEAHDERHRRSPASAPGHAAGRGTLRLPRARHQRLGTDGPRQRIAPPARCSASPARQPSNSRRASPSRPRATRASRSPAAPSGCWSMASAATGRRAVARRPATGSRSAPAPAAITATCASSASSTCPRCSAAAPPTSPWALAASRAARSGPATGWRSARSAQPVAAPAGLVRRPDPRHLGPPRRPLRRRAAPALRRDRLSHLHQRSTAWACG